MVCSPTSPGVALHFTHPCCISWMHSTLPSVFSFFMTLKEPGEGGGIQHDEDVSLICRAWVWGWKVISAEWVTYIEHKSSCCPLKETCWESMRLKECQKFHSNSFSSVSECIDSIELWEMLDSSEEDTCVLLWSLILLLMLHSVC